MKTTFTLLLFIVFKTNFCNAQTDVFREATMGQPQENWHPVKLDDAGNNVMNGLHLFNVKSECNSEKVSFIRLVNTNNYAVKFSYQVSPESPVITVTVPALKAIEGSCNSTDNNIKNLVFIVPADKTEQAKKNKEYMRSHIVVSPL